MTDAITLTWRDAFGMSVMLAGICSILNGAQLLWIRREFESGGILSWRVLRTSHPRLLRSRWIRAADVVFAPPVFTALIVIQVLAALVLVLRPFEARSWVLATVIAVRLLANFRSRVAMIGADQMQVVVLSACLVHASAPLPLVQAAGWFVALQLLLAYVAAGIVKLLTPSWRTGAALRGIVRTRSLGLRVAYLQGERFPQLMTAACWATIVFESVFPWLLFGGSALCLVFLATGLLFHLGVGVVMGFDEFLWAFAAAYPLALRCAMDVDLFWAVR
jgi:hypothetical protein